MKEPNLSQGLAFPSLLHSLQSAAPVFVCKCQWSPPQGHKATMQRLSLFANSMPVNAGWVR